MTKPAGASPDEVVAVFVADQEATGGKWCSAAWIAAVHPAVGSVSPTVRT